MTLSLLAAIGDEKLARQLIDAALSDDRVFADVDVPLTLWLMAIYLTDAGRMRVHPRHLAHILDVPMETAAAMAQRIRKFKDSLAPLAHRTSAAAS